MSHVDNYALFLTIMSDASTMDDALENIVEKINETIVAENGNPNNTFERVDQHAGGPKFFEARCFLLAGNYLPLDVVARAITSIDWHEPEGVMLIHHGQEDARFRSYAHDELVKLARAEAHAPLDMRGSLPPDSDEARLMTEALADDRKGFIKRRLRDTK